MSISPRKTGLVSLIVLTLIAIWPPTSYGQNCNDLIVDGANVFRGDISKVQEAAQKLVNSGADVRIRTVGSIADFGTLDAYQKHLENRCASWQDGNGYRKNNLLVLMIAMKERKTGLYYGSEWGSTLSPNWIRIQKDHMNPRFKAGNFAAGFANGLTEINRLVEAHLHPTPVTVERVQPSQPVVIVQPAQPSAPTDLSGLWKVLGGGLGLLFLGGIVFVFFRSRAAGERRRAIQQKARIAKQSVAKRINDLPSQIAVLEAEINTWKNRVAESDLDPPQNNLRNINKLYAQAAGDFNDHEQSAGNPDQAGLSESEYTNIEKAYNNSLETLRQAEQLRVQAEQGLRELEELVARGPQLENELKEALKLAASELGVVKSRGFKTGQLEEQWQTVQETVPGVEKGLLRHEYRQVEKLVTVGKTDLAEIIRSAKGLAQEKEAADKATEALAARIEEVKKAIISEKTTFDRLSKEYAPPSWESVRGNGSQATQKVHVALQAMGTAKNAGDMSNQNWEEARRLIRTANEELVQAESLVQSIAAMATHLDQARKDAPREIELAQIDITKAWEYIRMHDNDIRDTLENDLRGAEEKLASAKKALATSQPDYFTVNNLAKTANETADKILADARSEHEAAERLRQKTASAVRDAASRVSKAKEYIEDHREDVKRAAKEHLKDAKEKLRQAQAAGDLNRQLALAEEADREAKRAYDKARENVSESTSSYSPGGGGYAGGFGSSTVIVAQNPFRSEESHSPTKREEDSSNGGSSGWGFGDSGGGGSSSWGSDSGGGSSGGGSIDW